MLRIINVLTVKKKDKYIDVRGDENNLSCPYSYYQYSVSVFLLITSCYVTPKNYFVSGIYTIVYSNMIILNGFDEIYNNIYIYNVYTSNVYVEDFRNTCIFSHDDGIANQLIFKGLPIPLDRKSVV